MFTPKSILVPALMLLASFEARPDVIIVETEPVSIPLSFSRADFPISVPSFNTKRGTLDSVQIMLDLTVDFNGTLFSTGGVYDPNFGFLPTQLQYLLTTLPIVLEADGFPVNIVAVSQPSFPVIGTGPGYYNSNVVTPPQISNGSVPQTFFSAFESSLSPARLTLEQTGTVLSPLSPSVGSIIGDGSLQGFVQVEYDYTPFVTSTGPSATPEPAAAWLLAAGLTSLGLLHGKQPRAALEASLRYRAR